MNTSEAYRVAFEILGCRIAVEANAAEPVALLRGRFARYVIEDEGERAVVAAVMERGHGMDWEVQVEGRCGWVRRAHRWPGIDDVVKLLVVRGLPGLRFVHASCVAGPHGAALFVGCSRSGKSTLAWALHQGGFPLLADDLCPLDPRTGAVAPLVTSPTVRSYTGRLAWERAWLPVEGTSSRGLSPVATLRHVFFVAPVREAEPQAVIGVETAARLWEGLYRVCVGEEPPFKKTPTRVLSKHDERSFAGTPQLRSCSSARGLKRLLNHLHPPHPPLDQLLREVAEIADRTELFELRAGDLDQTVSLVKGILEC